MARNRIKKPFYKQAFPMIVFILLILYVVSFLLPFLWGIFASMNSVQMFTENIDIYNGNFTTAQLLRKMFALPGKTIDGSSGFSGASGMEPIMAGANAGKNYIWAIKNMTAPKHSATVVNAKAFYPELMFNALIYALGGTIITTLSHAITAYIAARYSHHKVAAMLYPIVIVTMVLPIVGSLPSELAMMMKLGWFDQLYGLLLMKGGFLGTNFLIFYATFKGISWEYAEAAFVDGASHLRVLVQIMLPLAATSLGALGLISFITFWNDWKVNLVYIPTNWPMISYALYMLVGDGGKSGINDPRRIAAALIVATPLIILFVAFRKKLMGNLTIGGIKG